MPGMGGRWRMFGWSVSTSRRRRRRGCKEVTGGPEIPRARFGGGKCGGCSWLSGSCVAPAGTAPRCTGNSGTVLSLSAVLASGSRAVGAAAAAAPLAVAAAVRVLEDGDRGRVPPWRVRSCTWLRIW